MRSKRKGLRACSCSRDQLLSRVKRVNLEPNVAERCEYGLTKAKKENNFRISVSAFSRHRTMGRRRMKTFEANGERNEEKEYRKRNETEQRSKRKRAPKNGGTEIERGNANTVFPSPHVFTDCTTGILAETPELFISVRRRAAYVFVLVFSDRGKSDHVTITFFMYFCQSLIIYILRIIYSFD